MGKLKTRPKVDLGKGGPSAKGWHKIADFLRCPKAYQYGQVRGIHKPQAQTPDHFAVGILHHAMRARWFAEHFDTGEKTWEKIKRAAQEATEEQKLPITIDAERKAMAMFQLYMDYWSLRPRPEPVAAEYLVGPAALSEEFDEVTERTARLDDVSRYPEAGGKLCVGESKTTSTSVGDTVNQYTLHGQPLLQLLLWKLSPNGEAKHGPVAGIMLDVFVKPYEKKAASFGRVFVPVSDWTLKWYAESMVGYLRAAALTKWDTNVPRNVQGCTYTAGRMRVACEFRELCAHGPSASSLYVMGEGKSLRSYEGEVKPWE